MVDPIRLNDLRVNAATMDNRAHGCHGLWDCVIPRNFLRMWCNVEQTWLEPVVQPTHPLSRQINHKLQRGIFIARFGRLIGSMRLHGRIVLHQTDSR